MCSWSAIHRNRQFCPCSATWITRAKSIFRPFGAKYRSSSSFSFVHPISVKEEKNRWFYHVVGAFSLIFCPDKHIQGKYCLWVEIPSIWERVESQSKITCCTPDQVGGGLTVEKISWISEVSMVCDNEGALWISMARIILKNKSFWTKSSVWYL